MPRPGRRTPGPLWEPPDLPEPDGAALAALARRARAGLDYLGEPPPDWVPTPVGIDHDVAIVGGGQVGVAVAFALRRAGIHNVTVIEAAPQRQEGIWRGFARMHTLRSSKTLGGPEMGLPDLTFRAWYEAAYGKDAYRDLVRSPREAWADYLDWYRETVGVSVRYQTLLDCIEPVDGGLRLHLVRDGRAFAETARKVVLATGIAGCGAPAVPDDIAKLSRTLYAHTDELIDFAALRGREVGVLGAASSAFDAAAVALESGSTRVRLFSRHADLVRLTSIKAMAYAGVLDHFFHLCDADRWELMAFFGQRSAGPMPETVIRATRHGSFSLHLACGWSQVFQAGSAARVETPQGSFLFDFIIVGTGYELDLAARPELRLVAPHIALWGDRYRPPAGQENPKLACNPYLGPAYEFIEKMPGAAPYLKDLHAFNYGGIVSHGRAVGDIVALKSGLPRLVSAIGRDLFLADFPEHRRRLMSYSVPDLSGEEYATAIAHGAPR